MTRILSLPVALALLAGLAPLQAGDPPVARSADAKKPHPAPDTAAVELANVFRSVRIVRDLAAFDILNLSSQKEGAWMVAAIHRGGSHGRLLAGGELVTEVYGQWRQVELLSGTAPREGRYQWQEPPPNFFDRNLNMYDLCSPFTGLDGAVICQFFETRSGAAQFSSVTAVPDDWQTFVKPAYVHHIRHAADFADSDLNGLRKMADGENPFIALTALRHLLGRSTTAEEMDRLADLAQSLPKYRQAVLTLWLLKRNDDKARDVVSKAITRSKNADELTGLALGIESWTASKGRRWHGDPAAKKLRDNITERWETLGRSTADDDPWKSKSWQKILNAPGNPK